MIGESLRALDCWRRDWRSASMAGCGGITQSDHEVDPAYWFVAFTVVLTRLHHQEKSRGVAQDRDNREIGPDRRLRIGHVVDCFGAGGIATGVFTLIRSTVELVDHTIISLSDDLRLLARLPSPTPAYVIKPGPSKLIGFCARLALLARRQQLDVLHCNNQFAWLDASLAARIIGRPCLQTFHGVERPVPRSPGTSA